MSDLSLEQTVVRAARHVTTRHRRTATRRPTHTRTVSRHTSTRSARRHTRRSGEEATAQASTSCAHSNTDGGQQVAIGGGDRCGSSARLPIALSRYWLTSRVVFLPADLLPAGGVTLQLQPQSEPNTHVRRTSTRQLHRSAVASGGEGTTHACLRSTVDQSSRCVRTVCDVGGKDVRAHFLLSTVCLPQMSAAAPRCGETKSTLREMQLDVRSRSEVHRPHSLRRTALWRSLRCASRVCSTERRRSTTRRLRYRPYDAPKGRDG